LITLTITVGSIVGFAVLTVVTAGVDEVTGRSPSRVMVPVTNTMATTPLATRTNVDKAAQAKPMSPDRADRGAR
jgi:hypothetical protein